MKAKVENKTFEKRFKVVKEDNGFPTAIIKDCRDAVDYCRLFYGDDIEVYESFFLLMLNIQNKTIAYAKISQGGTVSTVVDVKILAKYAIDSLANKIIICHNHPSGNVQPSQQDINLTQKVKQAMALFDIALIDSLIITANDYYSFNENLKL